MRATKVILTLLFMVTLCSASSYAAWTAINSPAQNLNALDGIASTSITTLCAVGNAGTVLISNDYGANWTPKTAPSANNVTDVSIVGNSVWVGTSAGEIFESTNWGTSWTDRTPAGVFDVIYSIKFSSANNGVVAGQLSSVPEYRVRYTSNGGANWNTPATALYGGDYNGIAATDANTFHIAGPEGRIYKSTDGGNNWERRDPGDSTNELFGIHFADASNGYAVGSSNKILKTINGGTNWTSLSFSGTGVNDFKDVFVISASNAEICGRDATDSLAAKIFETTDGGTNWPNTYTNPTSSTVINDLFFIDASNRFAVGVGSSGLILGNIAPVTLASVFQTARPTQHQAPVGFSGNLTFTGVNFQAGSWAPGDISFSGTGITVNSVTRNNDTQLTVNTTISTGAATGARDITVTNVDGSSDTLISGFSVSPLPFISSLYPASGTQNTTITGLKIKGSDFQSGTWTASNISFSGTGITVSTNVSRNSTFEITCDITIASTAATGLRNVYVTNPDGGISNNNSFTVQSSAVVNPTITAITPEAVTQGATGQLVTLEGTTFNAGIIASFESDGITINSLTLNSATRLTLDIDVNPTAPPGPRAISVRNTDSGAGSSADNNVFLYVRQSGAVTPTITTLEADRGYQGNQNLSFIVNGTNFESGAWIDFYPSTGITVNNIEFLSASQLRITIAIDTSAALGTRDIVVTNYPSGGFASKLGAFSILAQDPAPSVVGIGLAYPSPWNPNKGPVSIQFRLSKDDIIDIPVVTMDGRTVHKFNVNAHAGYNTVTWDGRTFDGHQVSAGMVLLPIVSKTQNKQIGKVKLMVVPWH